MLCYNSTTFAPASPFFDFEDLDSKTALEKEELKKKEEEEAAAAEEEETFDEREFQFDSYLKKFYTNSIVQVYLRMFELYKHNDNRINHCIVMLLHRLSNLEIGLLDQREDEINEKTGSNQVAAIGETILYQVSYLDLFERILSDRALKKERKYSEVLGFVKSTVRHFIRLLKSNPFLLVEALFWRTRKSHVILQNGNKDPQGSGSRDKSKRYANDDMVGSSNFGEGDQDDEEEAELNMDHLTKQSKSNRR